MNPGAAAAIIFVVIVVVLVSVCAINSCNTPDAAQHQNDKDGNMVVLDGVQVAQAVVEVQPGCCCGGGDGGGGGCGGCGGD